MTTPLAYALLLWGRFRCRRLGRHSGRVWMQGGYSVRWCRRCWATRVVEVARWG